MKKITVPCQFGVGDTKSPFTFYIGTPAENKHPLACQAWCLEFMWGGVFPKEVMDSIQKLNELALNNNVSFEELTVWAFTPDADDNDAEKENTAKKKDEAKQELPAKTTEASAYPAELAFLKQDIKAPVIPDFYTEYRTQYEKASPYRTGLIYEHGYGVAKDLKKAFSYFSQGASSDYRCAYKLVSYYGGEKEDAVKKDIEKQVSFTLDAIALGGDANVIHNLCIDLDCNEERRKIILKTKASYEKATYKDTKMLLILGVLSLIQNEPIKLALDYFKKAVEAKNSVAYYYLGLIYERGMGGLTPDVNQAIAYYQRATDHPVAMYRLGDLYNVGTSSYCYSSNQFLDEKKEIEKDRIKATFYLEKAAQQFYVPAQVDLAWRYFNGREGLNVDYAKAVSLAKQALLGLDADFANCDAAYIEEGILYDRIGTYYQCVQHDYLKAIYYYFYGFEKTQSTVCLIGLLECYYEKRAGLVLNANKMVAMTKYLAQQSQQGNPDIPKPRYVHYILGRMYYEGWLVPQDLAKAKSHLQQAFDLYEERLKKDSDNSDSVAWAYLGKMAEMGVLPNKQPASFYYQKASECKLDSFYSRVYSQAAKERLSVLEPTALDADNNNSKKSYSLEDSLSYAQTYLSQRNYTHALGWYNYALGLDSQNIAALEGKANVLLLMKQPVEAQDCYQTILMIQPQHSGAKQRLAVLSLNKPSSISSSVTAEEARLQHLEKTWEERFTQLQSDLLKQYTSTLSTNMALKAAALLPTLALTPSQQETQQIAKLAEATPSEFKAVLETEQKLLRQQIEQQQQFHDELEVTKQQLEEKLKKLTVEQQKQSLNQQQQQQLKQEVQSIQAQLASVDSRLQAVYLEYETKRKRRENIQRYQSDPNLILFYRTIQIKLEELFISYKAVAGGFVDATEGNLSTVKSVFEFFGDFVSIAPLVGNLGDKVLKWTVGKALEKTDEKRQTNTAVNASSLVTFSEVKKYAENIARLLTDRYEEQIKRLATLEEEHDKQSKLSHLADKGKAKVFKTKRLSSAEKLAAFIFTWLVDELDDSHNIINAKKPLDEQLFAAVCEHMPPHAIKDFWNHLTTKLGVSGLLTKSGEEWHPSDICMLSGIKTSEGKYYGLLPGNVKPKVAVNTGKYGFRLGTVEEVTRCSLVLVAAPVKAVKAVQSPSLSPATNRQVVELTKVTKQLEQVFGDKTKADSIREGAHLKEVLDKQIQQKVKEELAQLKLSNNPNTLLSPPISTSPFASKKGFEQAVTQFKIDQGDLLKQKHGWKVSRQDKQITLQLTTTTKLSNDASEEILRSLAEYLTEYLGKKIIEDWELVNSHNIHFTAAATQAAKDLERFLQDVGLGIAAPSVAHHL